MFEQRYDVEIGLGKLFKRWDFFHLLFPQTLEAAGDLASSKALWMLQQQFHQLFHDAILARIVP